ncbi:site-specific integrase [Streptomyces olivochromogenes]|uniref:Site-specific integrase n=1 Tax=Streptomyces olivochromogenes TaxID=1963 RepID=A0A250VFY0_STROL|nr:site-specific integrase [Streptomyces olivochromogenes]
MPKRRSRGDGGPHWDEKRQRWIATANLGFDPSGRRIVKRGSGKTETEAKNKLKEVLRDHEDALAIAPTPLATWSRTQSQIGLRTACRAVFPALSRPACS